MPTKSSESLFQSLAARFPEPSEGRCKLVAVGNRTKARKVCPWSLVVHEVDGGFACFEAWKDYMIWRDNISFGHLSPRQRLYERRTSTRRT